MEQTTSKSTLKLGHKYYFPEQSTADVEIIETLDNYVIFHENEFTWQGHYKAIWKDDEDPVTKIVADREKECFWRYTFERSLIGAVEYCWSMDLNMWAFTVMLKDIGHTVRLGFNSKANAEKMYNYFCEYKGFTNY